MLPATGIKIKVPKTASSIRKISLGNSTMLLLKQYRKWQLEQQLAIGDLWQDEDWVFTSWNGHIINPDSITRLFRKFILRHNIPYIRLHDLWHTSCTMLIQAGLNVRAVASRLGHSDPSVTLKTYAHALQSTDKEAANILENLVIKKSRQA